MLNLPDHSDRDTPVLTAADMLAYRWRAGRAPKISPPAAVIVCHQRDPVVSLLKQHRATQVKSFFSELYVLKTGRNPIGLVHSAAPGAPLLAATVEELIAFGVKRFISLGLAGSLQPDLHPGAIVLCDRAIRDEGTSHHYLPPARMVEADLALLEKISLTFSARGISHSRGASWTTDAPYRETRREVAAYRTQGVKTVEMEAAALLALGQSYSLQTAAVMVIGDRLADLTWQPPDDERPLRHSLVEAAAAIVESLSE